MSELYWIPNVTDPADADPLVAADLYDHLRIDGTTYDTELAAMIAAATALAQDYLGQQLINATFAVTGRRFPLLSDHPDYAIELPVGPIQSITSIGYTDGNGDAQTVDSGDTTLLDDRDPPLIVPAFGCSWPTARSQLDAVTVTLVAGYGTAGSSVPEKILHAIRFMVAELFRNREATNAQLLTVPVRNLLDACRGGRLP